MSKLLFIAGCAVAAACLSGCGADRSGDGTTVRERVQMVAYRTELRHAGCQSNGFMRVDGAPRMIESYAIDKFIWPHKCSGCGATNEIFDARWPKIEQRWEAVK